MRGTLLPFAVALTACATSSITSAARYEDVIAELERREDELGARCDAHTGDPDACAADLACVPGPPLRDCDRGVCTAGGPISCIPCLRGLEIEPGLDDREVCALRAQGRVEEAARRLEMLATTPGECVLHEEPGISADAAAGIECVPPVHHDALQSARWHDTRGDHRLAGDCFAAAFASNAEPLVALAAARAYMRGTRSRLGRAYYERALSGAPEGEPWDTARAELDLLLEADAIAARDP